MPSTHPPSDTRHGSSQPTPKWSGFKDRTWSFGLGPALHLGGAVCAHTVVLLVCVTHEYSAVDTTDYHCWWAVFTLPLSCSVALQSMNGTVMVNMPVSVAVTNSSWTATASWCVCDPQVVQWTQQTTTVGVLCSCCPTPLTVRGQGERGERDGGRRKMVNGYTLYIAI